ncbi:Type 1 glutamine amidotransferase-like domain-containing protein [Streptomyces sp. NPDC003273]|uniref:Type 1 glutamine amidotransferase-like domain-containing protein n=1 Tax=Streptomyces sp. NPDC003273 TaxID=3364678 RepID=UPI003676FBB7
MVVAPVGRVALLGGGFSTDRDGLLDDWLLNHARGPRPKVCFVPTASGDAPAYIDQFLTAFTSRHCDSSVLSLFRRELDDEALQAFLLSQDVVYVGGGNTANLLAVWRAHGVDRLLREAYSRGTLLCGISAGANCWAAGSHTDSFGPLTFLQDGLDFLPGSVCPHYDSEPGRRTSFRETVAHGMLPAGWALEDGVGAFFTNGRLEEAVTRRPEARLYWVQADEKNGVTEEVLSCRLLNGAPHHGS